MEWLKTQRPPLRVDGPRDVDHAGFVRTNLEAGTIVLQGARGDVTLVWKREDRERSRPLPAGSYRLRTTRVERTRGDDHWMISATARPGARHEVRKGAATTIGVADTVHFAPLAKDKGGGWLQLGFTVKAKDGRGLSVYRNDRRVSIRYEVIEKDGAALASGTMNYG